MSEGKFSVFDFAPKVVDKKARYRDEEQRKKLTYNFVTDPKMKRGHNFGVVYVTNSSMEEESMHGKKKEPQAKATETSVIEKKKKTIEIDVPRPPKGRENLGVNTSPVASTIRPKPLTFEMGVQIDMYVDRPQTPLFWPQKTGIDVESQIEDGELFHFDDEVEPILNVLLSKVLEQSRMEVLEEEEIKEMKKKQREFEEIRNRELTEVQKLEDKEARELAEKNRRVAQKKIEKDNRIINQKKLFARTFAKEYLSKIKQNTLKQLEQRGVFRSPMESQYQNNLLNYIYQNAEVTNHNDYVVLEKLNKTFEADFMDRKRKLHKEALDKERKRKEDLERKRQEEIERKKQEIIERKAEAARIKKEKELQALKNSIEEEFMKKVELVDIPENVYDVNGFAQMKPHASAIGGYYGQFVFLISYLNRMFADYMNEEKLTKMLELFIPKCPTMNILYKPEDLELYKALDATGSVNVIEDVLKLDDVVFNEILSKISNYQLENDKLLPFFLDFFTQLGYENTMENYRIFMTSLMKQLKSTDPTITDKIKFLMKDPLVLEDANNFAAICELFPISVPNSSRNVDTNTAKKATTKDKKQQVTKVTFDLSMSEKVAVIASASEKMRILVFNYPFERMLRSNIIECMNKINKIEGDIETFKEEFEQFYLEKFYEPIVEQMALLNGKDRIKYEDLKHFEANP